MRFYKSRDFVCFPCEHHNYSSSWLKYTEVEENHLCCINQFVRVVTLSFWVREECFFFCQHISSFSQWSHSLFLLLCIFLIGAPCRNVNTSKSLYKTERCLCFSRKLLIINMSWPQWLTASSLCLIYCIFDTVCQCLWTEGNVCHVLPQLHVKISHSVISK